MSIESQDTYATFGLPLTGIGGGSAISTFSTLTASTLNAVTVNAADVNSLFTSTTFLTANDAFLSNISALVGDISTLTTDFFSTNIAEIDEAYISSLSTKGIYLDGALLTTAGNELLLNGLPIATTSNISSIADWALDAAVSTVNLNGNQLINASYVSAAALQVSSGNIANLVCQDISTYTLTAFSTIHAISTISSSVLEAQSADISTLSTNLINSQAGFFSTINDQPVILNSANWAQYKASQDVNMGINNLNSTLSVVLNGSGTSTVLTSGAGNSLLINGAAIPTPGAVSDWANYPAISSVIVTNQKIVADKGINLIATSEINLEAQNGRNGVINLTAQPGFGGISGGAINLTANGGVNTLVDAGLYGAIKLEANPGVIGGIATGGLVSIIANSGIAIGNATSAVKISGGCVITYAGIANPIGSLFGYNYVYGTAGVSITTGLPPGPFQVPGTVYLYGTSGVVLNSDVYTTAIYPYWNGIAAPDNLLVSGRNTVSGNAYVILSNVTYMKMAQSNIIDMNGGTLRNVSSITDSVSFQRLNVSTINTGVIFTGASGITGTTGNYSIRGENILGLQTLVSLENVKRVSLDSTGDNLISFGGNGSITGLSTVNGAAFPPTFSVPHDLVVSTLTCPSTIFTSSLVTSTINGAAYPPTFAVPSDLIVSTLICPSTIFTSSLVTSTINGAAYPPTFAVPSDLIVSTLTVNSSIVGVSSINGAAFPPVFSPLSSISNSGASVVCNGLGELLLNTDNLGSTIITSGGDLVMQTANASVRIINQNFASTSIMLGSILSAGGDVVLSSSDDGQTYVIGPLSAPQIVSVSSINGQAFPPTFAVPSDLVVSSLICPSTIFTSSLITSTINGQAYPPTFAVPSDLVVSSLICPSTIFTSSLVLSTINGQPFQSVNLSVSTVNINPYGGGYVNTLAIINLSTINNVAYPPQPSLSTLTVSTLFANDYIFIENTGYLHTVSIESLSSVNNLSYPPPGASGFTVSSLICPSTIYTSTIYAGIMDVSTLQGDVGTLINMRQSISLQSVDADINLDSQGVYIGNHGGSSLLYVNAIGSLSSINGVAYPGVTSLNSLTGGVSLQAGTNITITPTNVSTLTIQAKNYPLSERATNIVPVLLTATTFATAQTILTFTITPTFISDIDINCSFYYQTNSNTQYDIIYYAQVDGLQVGITMKDSLAGTTHCSAVSIIASALSQTVATHTITIKAYAGSAPAAGNLTVIASSGYAIANLV